MCRLMKERKKLFSVDDYTGMIILSVYSPFSNRVEVPLHNIHIPSPFSDHINKMRVSIKFQK